LNKLVNADKIDLQKLEKACCSEFGLVNNEIRAKVWPILLSVDLVEYQRRIDLADVG
jgi:hypothetical protein